MRSRPFTFSRSFSLIAATVAALGILAGQALAQVPNIDVSLRPGNEAEHAIAVNPKNPSNIVAMSTLSESTAVGTFVGTSFDGGATWTRRVIGTGSDDLGPICCDEQLAWDSFGNLWMVYLFNDANENVPIALSTDGGLSFHKVAEIVPIKPTGATEPSNSSSKGNLTHKGQAGADQPSISAAHGSVWVSYTVYPSTVVQAVGAKVRGLGRFSSFGTPESVPGSFGKGNYGDTAVGPNGQVMVIYQDATSGQGGSRIYSAVDPDGFGSNGFNDPVLVARSRVGGFDYLPVQPERSVDAEANLAWDRSGGAHNGRVYAIWTDEVKTESNDMDIELQYSDNNGSTWSRAVRLNDDATTNSQVNPAIALDQTTGAVGVSWYDARNDLGNGGAGDLDGVPNTDVQIYATFSKNGGASFAPNLRVSEGTSHSGSDFTGSGFNFGDYTHAAFQSGTFWPAWSDNSNSTGNNPDGTHHKLDLYTAKVAVG